MHLNYIHCKPMLHHDCANRPPKLPPSTIPMSPVCTPPIKISQSLINQQSDHKLFRERKDFFHAARLCFRVHTQPHPQHPSTNRSLRISSNPLWATCCITFHLVRFQRRANTAKDKCHTPRNPATISPYILCSSLQLRIYANHFPTTRHWSTCTRRRIRKLLHSQYRLRAR